MSKAKRGEDNVFPPLFSMNLREETFCDSMRELLGSGYAISFTQTGDEVRAIFSDKKLSHYGAGETISEALACALMHLIQVKKIKL